MSEDMNRELIALNMIGKLIDEAPVEIDDIVHRIRSGDQACDVTPLFILRRVRDTVSWALGTVDAGEFLRMMILDLSMALELLEDE